MNQEINSEVEGGVAGRDIVHEGDNLDVSVCFAGDYVHGSKTVVITPASAPPPDNPNRRLCPQCGGITWLRTEVCLHCGCNLFALDAFQRSERLKRRQFKAMLIFGAVGIAGMYLGKYAPENLRLWIYGVAFFCAMVAISVTKK